MSWKNQILNQFVDQLNGDPLLINESRQVNNAHYSQVSPQATAQPTLIIANKALADTLRITEEDLKGQEFTEIMSGNTVISTMTPYAMCYGGHQFGHWAGQLGDGRAINLSQLQVDKTTYTLQLKGAGPTPYSRSADGLAVLRSSIREYLMSEAMYHLGVPTTRALSLCLTGDRVLRDIMYDGNPDYEPGAVVCRISESFVRFGSFQIFAARQDLTNLQALLDYVISNHYPEIPLTAQDKYLQFLQAVMERTVKLMLEWQRVGFVHGVMNTDNMSILGETIDYGPYGWVDNYDPAWTPNTTDNANKRYRFGNQPYIAQWNLAQLANAIYPLVNEAEPFARILEDYKINYQKGYHQMMASKLGLSADSIGTSYIQDLNKLMQSTEVDMTLFYRQLSDINSEDSVTLALTKLLPMYYQEPSDQSLQSWTTWIADYLHKIGRQEKSNADRHKSMKTINPKYVLRNYMAQMAIDEAEKGNYELIHKLYQLLQNPYDEQVENEKWYAKRPDWAKDKVGCSALSCSS